MEVLMICREQKIMNVDVHGCTNALKDRMSERGHPEHKKADNIVGFIM
jgi:hypothetical protein